METRTKNACRTRTVTTLHSACSVLLACTMVSLAGIRNADAQLPPTVETAPRSHGDAASAPQKQAAAASRDSLFEDDPPATKDDSKAPPASRDSLFGDDAPAAAASKPASAWRGFLSAEAAYSFREPAHWSKERLRLELIRQGQFSENVKWKIGGRFEYDGAYDRSNFYAPQVQQDQRYGFMLRENYLDISAGDLEFRLGRQHVVWGEMVGLFIADVVSARDMREFILPEPDLESLRIPQWAARAEYFMKDMKAEVLWIPVPSYDEIGKPGIPGVRGVSGADFYPYPIPGPGGSVFLNEERPSGKLSNTNYGVRVSGLKGGWDMSGFYYHSLDATPTFYRNVIAGPAPVFVYQARHDPINQFGGTFAKDLGIMVLKGEAVYTTGRQLNVTRIDQPNGLVRQDMIDYALGLDFSLPSDTRLNLQFFQRIYTDHDPDTFQRKYESGASVLLEGKLASNWEARALLAHSLNSSGMLFRTRIAWLFEKNWRLQAGVDIFGGPPTGAFGRYDNNDRVYTELRYTF
jgi:hypothetical protein